MNFAAESHVDRSIDGPGGVRPDQRRRHVPAARGGARLPGRASRRRARALPLPARLDRRGLRLARARRSGVHRDDPLRAEQPVLGVEGGVRPPGARLPPHLRPADAHDQLLEQLRPVPVSGEADPADDPQRARGQAAAGLRRRAERARLALRRRPLRGDPRGARAAAASARRTTSAATPSRRTSTSCTRSAGSLDGAAPAARALRGADHVRHGPSGPRPPLRDRRRARSRASSAGRRRRRSRPACAAPCTGTWTTDGSLVTSAISAGSSAVRAAELTIDHARRSLPAGRIPGGHRMT